MRDCPAFRQWQLGPANRGSSGSLAINDFSGTEAPTRRAIYRFFRAAGDAALDLVTLGLADQWGMREHTLDQDSWATAVAVARILLENYLERPQESVKPPRLLDGHDIMRAYGIQPGPTVGQLLEAIREAQAIGEVTDRETGLAFGRRWLEGRHS